MKKKVKQISKFRKYTLLIVIVMITIFCIETVGYAQISRLIKIGGDVTWKVDGKLLITNVSVDETGKKNGKGAYITKDLEVLETAKKKKVLEKVFEMDDLTSVYEEIYNLIK